MKANYDPEMLALFVRAEQAFDGNDFARKLMARIDRDRRRIAILWSAVGVAAIAVLVLLAGPLTAAVGLASNLLPVELVDIEARWLQLLLSPVNSVAAAIAIGALALRYFYRRIFG